MHVPNLTHLIHVHTQSYSSHNALHSSLMCILTLSVNLFIQSMHSTSELKNDFSKSKPKFFSAPEVKLLILSIFLSIIGVVTIGTYSSVTGDQSAYATRFLQYTNCLLCGNDPKCTMESASDHFRVASNAIMIGQLAYCLLFAVNIVFTLNASDLSKISKSCAVPAGIARRQKTPPQAVHPTHHPSQSLTQ